MLQPPTDIAMSLSQELWEIRRKVMQVCLLVPLIPPALPPSFHLISLSLFRGIAGFYLNVFPKHAFRPCFAGSCSCGVLNTRVNSQWDVGPLWRGIQLLTGTMSNALASCNPAQGVSIINVDEANRTCELTATSMRQRKRVQSSVGKISMRLKITFPALYPNNAPPSFHFVADPKARLCTPH